LKPQSHDRGQTRGTPLKSCVTFFGDLGKEGSALDTRQIVLCRGLTPFNLFYMLSCAFMNIGAFAVIILIGKKGEKNGNVSNFAGLGFKKPLLAVIFSVFLFSLAGMPPTAGFVGKFYLFSAAIRQLGGN